MALPKLNALPKYTVNLPSRKIPVRYRPFLVKEQKLLLMAMESQDSRQVVEAVSDIITACVESDVKTKHMTMYDIEFLFAKIRSKSVGENIQLKATCSDENCEHQSDVEVNIGEANVSEVEETYSMIQLTEEISLKVSHPSYERILQVQNSGSQTETIMELIMASIDTVLTAEEQITFKDHTHEEKIEFVDSLTTDQLGSIISFLETMPALTSEIHWNCEACGKENTRILRGLNDFF